MQIVLAEHNDHLTVARILLNSQTSELGLGLPTPALPVLKHNFTGKQYVLIDSNISPYVVLINLSFIN